MRDDFRSLADLFPEPLLLLSSDGTLEAVNAAAAEALNLSPGEIVGRNLQRFIVEAADHLRDYLRACARTRGLVPGVITFQTNGETRAFRAAGGLYRSRSSECESLLLLRLTRKESAVNKFLLLNEQITRLDGELRRQRRYEERLYEQAERFRVTLASIGDAVIATDRAGHITFMNPPAEELTGWSSDESVGRPLDAIFRIINEHTREVVESPIDRVFSEGVTVGLANHTMLIRKDNSEVAIADSGSPIRDRAGRLIGAVLVFRDVSEQRALHRELTVRATQLELADRKKDEYLAMLAHELRNPLAPLRNAIHVLEATNSAVPHHREMLAVMRRQVDHLARLVGDLLDVSRITQGKVVLKLELIDVRDVVPLAVELARPVLDRRGHSLTTQLPEYPLHVRADRDRLTQVISNLLDNAAKYTDEGGQIRLECSAQNTVATISVRDNGIGIAPELLPHVFDLFTQGDTSLDKTTSGLGVGLTLVRALVEQHGGSVHVSSEGIGRGSTFSIKLRLV